MRMSYVFNSYLLTYLLTYLVLFTNRKSRMGSLSVPKSTHTSHRNSGNTAYANDRSTCSVWR